MTENTEKPQLATGASAATQTDDGKAIVPGQGVIPPTPAPMSVDESASFEAEVFTDVVNEKKPLKFDPGDDAPLTLADFNEEWDKVAPDLATEKKEKQDKALEYDLTVAGYEAYVRLKGAELAKARIQQEDTEEVVYAFSNSAERRKRPQVSFLIDKLVLNGPNIGILFGPEQAFKSFVTAHLAMSLVNDAESWFGYPICKREDAPARHALVILMEGAESYQQRLDALTIAYPGWSDSGVVTMENQPVDVSSQKRMDALVKGVREHTVDGEPFRPAIIIVDTQGLAMGETDEYNRPAMRQVYKNARALAVEFGCFVLMVTHPGNTNQHRPAGASSQAQDADVMIRAYRDGTLEVVKSKHSGERGKKFHHVQETHGDSLAIRWVGDQAMSEQAKSHFAVQRERADRIVEAVRELTAKKPGGVSKTDVCTKVGGKKEDVLQLIDALVDNGRLHNLGSESRPKLVTDESASATM